MQKLFYLLLFIAVFFSAFARRGKDTTILDTNNKSYKLKTEIYPSPIYTIINAFDKVGGFYPIPFKSRILYKIDKRISLGLGLEEQVFFDTYRYSQWFFTGDYYFMNRKNSSLAITAEAGFYSFLDICDHCYASVLDNPIPELSLRSIFLRAGITWSKRIVGDFFGLLFVGYRDDYKLDGSARWVPLLLGASYRFSGNSSKLDTLKNMRLGIAFCVMDNILQRKNDNLFLPFDNNGNLINQEQLWENTMFFLGRITPGIEINVTGKHHHSHSLGFIYNKTFPFVVPIPEYGSRSYNILSITCYYDYIHTLKKNEAGIAMPYVGARVIFENKEVDYSDSYSQAFAGPFSKDIIYNYKSRAGFLQSLAGVRMNHKHFIVDFGLACNLFAIVNHNHEYYYKRNQWNPSPPQVVEFQKTYNSSETIYPNEFIKEGYFLQDIYLKVGYKF